MWRLMKALTDKNKPPKVVKCAVYLSNVATVLTCSPDFTLVID